MKTLYLTDLDGTLLNSKAELTKHSADILNKLIDDGMLFTVATARTSATVMEMFSEVKLNLPLILMNGVLLYDIKKEKNIICHGIDQAAADEIIEIFEKYGKSPMFYFQREDYLEIFYKDLSNKHQMSYVNNRKNLSKKQFKYSDTLSVSDSDNLIYVVTLDFPHEIQGIYEDIIKSDKVTCAFYSDNYTDCNFLECMSKKASKATTALELKELLDVDRIVAFGDNLNDIPLFEIADEAYAVSNAHDDLKKIATGVIGSNDEDAVAEFLLSKFYTEQM